MTQTFIERALYHGLAGILVNRPRAILGWPAAVIDRLRQQALGQGMWELRHKLVVVALIEALAQAGVSAILLKGTALAYDLYADPAERCRALPRRYRHSGLTRASCRDAQGFGIAKIYA